MNHRNQYLPPWEEEVEAQYKTFVYDNFGVKNEHFLCWLYVQDNSMRCRLCEKYNKTVNTNGKIFYYFNLLFFSIHIFGRAKVFINYFLVIDKKN